MDQHTSWSQKRSKPAPAAEEIWRSSESLSHWEGRKKKMRKRCVWWIDWPGRSVQPQLNVIHRSVKMACITISRFTETKIKCTTSLKFTNYYYFFPQTSQLVVKSESFGRGLSNSAARASVSCPRSSDFTDLLHWFDHFSFFFSFFCREQKKLTPHILYKQYKSFICIYIDIFWQESFFLIHTIYIYIFMYLYIFFVHLL